MKKIAIVDNVGNKAGMDYYDLSLLKSLSKLSVKTYLFSNFQKNNTDIIIKNVFNTKIKNNVIKALNYFKGYLTSYIKCKFKKIDAVILHIFSASYLSLLWVVLAKIFRLKIIVIAHDISSFSNDDYCFIKKIIYSWLSESIVVHNQFSFDEISKVVSKKSLRKIYIIKQGNYLDFINNISKPDALRNLNLDYNYRYILFFGQIKKAKGLDILLKSMPFINKDIKLIIAGRPWKDNFLHYQSIIDKLRIQERIVKYVRYISNEERDLLFSVSDAFIMPYKKIYQSAVQLMGMSYGLPVIASDLKQHREIIEQKTNGMLFKSEDHLSLAKAINYLLDDRKLISKIRQNSIKTARDEYSWDKIAEKYVEMLKK